VKGRLKLLLPALLAGLVVLLTETGCQSSQHKEALLTQAGFRSLKPTSAKQTALIGSLPRGHLTSLVRNGKTVFLYPDAKQHLLLAGTEKEYQAYQKLRLKNELSMDTEATTSLNSDATSVWSNWGGLEIPYWGPEFNDPSPR
jgi:hypothetical protein